MVASAKSEISSSIKDGSVEQSNCIIKGKYKSGRFWKTERPRFSSINKVKPLKLRLTKKDRLRQERKELLSITNAIKEEKKRSKAELRNRQDQNKQRKLANERKAEVVQVISDSRKIKRMSRKQLKSIEKRDTS